MPSHIHAKTGQALPAVLPAETILECSINQLHYGSFRAVRDTHMAITHHAITALIGPSGCGKSSVLRCLNRMNDHVRGFRLDGYVKYRGRNIYERSIDPVAVRRHIGMVFQQPNPYAMSIRDNIVFGLHINGYTAAIPERVERALRRVWLWDEVKDKLHDNALSLSGGQQQRLCIARAIAIEPDILLMDEPCSALDPVATRKIEELMRSLKERYAITIVTHNMQQAERVADNTAFMYVDNGTGYLVEYGPTPQIFQQPREEPTRQYMAGRFS